MAENMKSIVIDNIDFTNLEAQKYWSFPKSYDLERRKVEAKNYATSGNYIGARKMDGIWSMVIKDNKGQFHVRSRTPNVDGGFANKAEWIPQICNSLKTIPNGTVIIGEIYFPNNEGSRKVTSTFNCLKEKCLERQKKNGYLHLYIFDILAYDNKNIMDLPIEKRVNSYLYKLQYNNNYIEIAKYKESDELWNLYCEVIANGGEGIVITKKSASYAPGKRTARVTLKMKKELQNTIDAFVDGMTKQSTKTYTGKEIETWTFWINDKTGEKFHEKMYKEYISGMPIIPVTKAFFYDWASAISFSVYKDGKPVHIAWISNIPDKIKQGIVTNPEDYVGKVAELTAMEIENIDDKYSLRHGKIEQWRDDKSAEDCTFEQIANS